MWQEVDDVGAQGWTPGQPTVILHTRCVCFFLHGNRGKHILCIVYICLYMLIYHNILEFMLCPCVKPTEIRVRSVVLEQRWVVTCHRLKNMAFDLMYKHCRVRSS